MYAAVEEPWRRTATTEQDYTDALRALIRLQGVYGLSAKSLHKGSVKIPTVRGRGKKRHLNLKSTNDVTDGKSNLNVAGESLPANECVIRQKNLNSANGVTSDKSESNAVVGTLAPTESVIRQPNSNSAKGGTDGPTVLSVSGVREKRRGFGVSGVFRADDCRNLAILAMNEGMYETAREWIRIGRGLVGEDCRRQEEFVNLARYARAGVRVSFTF